MTESSSDSSPVMNQSPDFVGHNAYTSDPLLRKLTDGLKPETKTGLAQHGKWAGMAETRRLASLANKYMPVLQTHDHRGNRLDEVEYHPAWHALMRRSVSLGLHASIWEDIAVERGTANLARAARFFITSGVETGHLCPITMTNASIAALRATPDVLGEWLPRIKSRTYDSTLKPPVKKNGLTIGMGMTERQGGSDLSTNTTVAEVAGEGLWRITGQKWFLSAPMCDAFLVLAQIRQNGKIIGPGCFMVPRVLPDGTKNGLCFLRLKDKLGNRSNASAEVEFQGSFAQLIGEPGKGISTIMEMVSMTRLDCAIASAGLMRSALAEAVHHCRHRTVMGGKLVDQPLMRRVLADLSVDVAGATALAFRLARALDRAPQHEAEAAYARLMTPVIKYWVCKMAPAVIAEAMECLGGNGYSEDFALARHYREAPVNSIWEGAGNVMCLDVLRVIEKEPRAVEGVIHILENEFGGSGGAKTVNVIASAISMARSDPGSSRILTEQLAITAAGAELRRLGQGKLADAFVESRLGGMWRYTHGMLDNRYDANAILRQCFVF